MTLSNSWRSELDPERVMQANVMRWQEGNCYEREDHLAVEEPFEVHIEHSSLATIMRTPGHDFELALGFLLEPDILQISSSIFYSLPQQLRSQQAVFKHTGGLHAAGLFTAGGEMLLLREDVGRHNAVDKVIGHGLLHGGYPYRELISFQAWRVYQVTREIGYDYRRSFCPQCHGAVRYPEQLQ